MCCGFLVAWFPYAVVSIMGVFGNPQDVNMVVSLLPVMLTKTSILYNPIIYFYSNQRYRVCVRRVLRCGNVPDEGQHASQENDHQGAIFLGTDHLTANRITGVYRIRRDVDGAANETAGAAAIRRVNSGEIREWIKEMDIVFSSDIVQDKDFCVDRASSSSTSFTTSTVHPFEVTRTPKVRHIAVLPMAEEDDSNV